MLKKHLKLLLLVFLITSCKWLHSEETYEDAIAKAGNAYLFVEEIPEYLHKNVSKEDSIIAVKSYIDKWAATQLLLEKALINLPEEEQRDFDKLVTSYKADLYTRAYKQALMRNALDTIVKVEDMEAFYAQNKENFKLNEKLVKFRYIALPLENASVNQITSKLKRYNEEDAKYLDSIDVQFKSHSLSTDRWISAQQILQKIPIVAQNNPEKILKKSQFVSLKDSIGVYLIRVEDVLQRNETAPLEYVVGTIRQILLNKKKLEYIKKLEKDILTEAVEKNDFEIYE
ncbi:MAG: peptidyl-prolyl cis-trans isomerase [Flavobacteriaceae bacterium]|nr:peptidyl-prolyl cis-trans isomerase [Flavobacteriaceae bacterium]